MKKLLVILGIVLLALTTVYSVTFINTTISSVDNSTVINITEYYDINVSSVDIGSDYVYFDNMSLIDYMNYSIDLGTLSASNTSYTNNCSESRTVCNNFSDLVYLDYVMFELQSTLGNFTGNVIVNVSYNDTYYDQEEYEIPAFMPARNYTYTFNGTEFVQSVTLLSKVSGTAFTMNLLNTTLFYRNVSDPEHRIKQFYQNNTLNSTINWNFTEENITTAGLLTDFYFFDESMNWITNYILGNNTINTTNPSALWYSELINGLTFYKNGFVSFDVAQTYSRLLKNTFSYTVNSSTVYVYLYDRDTELPITVPVELEFVGNYSVNTTTSNGTAIFTNVNFANGTYKIIAVNEFYETEELVFDFDNEEKLNFSMWLLNSSNPTKSTMKLIIKDNDLNFVVGAKCEALEFKTSFDSFISVSQSQSNENGECFLNIELKDELYQFQVSKDGVTKLTTSERIYIEDDVRTILLGSTTSIRPTIEDTYSWSLSETIGSDNTTNITFYVSSKNGETITACLKAYQRTGIYRTLIDESCATSSTIDMVQSYNINQSSPIEVEPSVYVNNQEPETILKTYKYASSDNIREAIGNDWIVKLIPIMIILIGIGVALVSEVVFGLVVIMIGLISFSYLFLGVIGGTVIGVLIIILSIIGWGTYRRRFGQ